LYSKDGKPYSPSNSSKAVDPFREYIYGFASMKGLLHEKYDGYFFGISIGRKLDDNIINGIKDAPTLEYIIITKRSTGNCKLFQRIFLLICRKQA